MSAYPTLILVASDGSPDARLAEQIAADLGTQSGAQLHVVHAWREVPTGAYPYPALTADASYQMFKESAEQTLRESVERIEAAGGKVAGRHLRHGSPAREIAAMADELGIDLLIIGSRGHSTIHRLVVGSVSETVVHHLGHPTLVVRGGPDAWPPAQVIIGDDGAAGAARAAALGAALARHYGAKIILTRAVPELPPFRWYEEEKRPMAEKIQEDLLARSRDELATRARCLIDDGGAAPDLALVAGEPAEVILGVAEAKRTPALIALGCRGLGTFDRLRLGSVSTKLLHAAQGPLLIVPGEGDEGQDLAG